MPEKTNCTQCKSEKLHHIDIYADKRCSHCKTYLPTFMELNEKYNDVACFRKFESSTHPKEFAEKSISMVPTVLHNNVEIDRDTLENILIDLQKRQHDMLCQQCDSKKPHIDLYSRPTCPYCIQFLPTFTKLHEQYKDKF